MKILFTSVGRRVELIQAFYSAARLEKIALSIHGADISEAAPALMFCDKRHIVPPISNTDYIYSLLEIAEKEKIDILIPTIDTKARTEGGGLAQCLRDVGGFKVG